MSEARHDLLLVVVTNHRSPWIRHRKAGILPGLFRLRRGHASTDAALATVSFDIGLHAFVMELMTARAIGPRKRLLIPRRRQLVVTERARLTRPIGTVVAWASGFRAARLVVWQPVSVPAPTLHVEPMGTAWAHRRVIKIVVAEKAQHALPWASASLGIHSCRSRVRERRRRSSETSWRNVRGCGSRLPRGASTAAARNARRIFFECLLQQSER